VAGLIGGNFLMNIIEKLGFGCFGSKQTSFGKESPVFPVGETLCLFSLFILIIDRAILF